MKAATMPLTKKPFKGILKYLVVGALLMLLFVLLSNLVVIKSAHNRLFYNTTQVPARKTAVLLGTTSRLRNGYENQFFKHRIEAAAFLYFSGKVKYIIVSGDNRHRSYNEPRDMQRALLAKGVPQQAIYLDYAGFRTFDSMVRSKEVFGQDSIIVVSQKFHVQRALFIAGYKGIDAIGYCAQDVSRQMGMKTYIREFFARPKVVLDLLFGKQPKFLGEPVKVG